MSEASSARRQRACARVSRWHPHAVVSSRQSFSGPASVRTQPTPPHFGQTAAAPAAEGAEEGVEDDPVEDPVEGEDEDEVGLTHESVALTFARSSSAVACRPLT